LTLLTHYNISPDFSCRVFLLHYILSISWSHYRSSAHRNTAASCNTT